MVKSAVSLKEIFAIAIPIMLGNVSMSIAGIADTIFMEKIGHAQMDAVGYCSLLLFIIAILGWATARGVQILTAQFEGAEHFNEVGPFFDMTTLLLSAAGILCFIVFRFFTAPIMELLISDKEVLKYCIEYTTIRSWSFLFVNLSFAISAFYTGIGKTRIMIFAVATTALLNIFLNYVLVFGKYGFEPMGVSGSAWATNISDFLSAAIYLGSIWLHRGYLTKYELFTFKQIDLSIVKKILVISAPLVVQHLFSLGAWVLFFTWIESIGTKELAASMIIKSIYMFLCIPGFSLGTTTNTVVGQFVGRKETDQIIPAIKSILLVSFSIVFVYTALSYIFIDQWIYFYTSDQHLRDMILQPFQMVLIGILFFPFGNTVFQGVVSLGNTRRALYLEVITIVLYTLYMYAVIKVFKLSLAWAWSTEIFYWIVLFIFAFVYFKFSRWKEEIQLNPLT